MYQIIELSFFGWKLEGWEQVINGVIAAGVLSTLVLLLLEILNSIKDTKALNKEHDSLSKEHGFIKQKVSEEHSRTRESMEKDYRELRSENARLTQMVTALTEESVRRSEREKLLASEQPDIKKSIDVLQVMKRQIELLQAECSQLRQENAELKKQLTRVNEINTQLRKQLKQIEMNNDNNIEQELAMY